MELSALSAISPIDGRYGDEVRALRAVFSEYGLIRLRVRVEIEWLRTLAGHPAVTEEKPLGEEAMRALDALAEGFDEAQAARVKAIERETNHDVKAVEYYLRERLGGRPELRAYRELVHFACTSEDINNLSHALALKEARREALLPGMDALIEALRTLAHRHAARPMLARTHGQPATPTTLGKEMAVFAARLERQRNAVAGSAIRGKMNGAVGNYNAHLSARPDLDWPGIAKDFVEGLGLDFNPYTTQIEPHDWMAELFHATERFNTVLIDLCRDVLDLHFARLLPPARGRPRGRVLDHAPQDQPHRLRERRGQPRHRQRPALPSRREAPRLALAAGLERLHGAAQRRGGDRPLAPCLPVLPARHGPARSRRGGDGTRPRRSVEVLAEPIQTVLRYHGVAGAYEQMKQLTRGRPVDRDTLDALIRGLAIPEEARERLRALTPRAYTGSAARLASEV